MLPVIKPENKLKLLWDFFILLVVFFCFFIFPIQISFSIKTFLIEDFFFNSDGLPSHVKVNLIMAILLIVDVLLKLTSAFYEKGHLIDNKFNIIKNYWKNSFLIDLASIVIVILQSIINSIEVAEENALIKLCKVSQILIFLKIFEVNRTLNLIEEIIHFGKKGIVFFRFFKLTISIFFFSHNMACIWHAVSYYSSSENNMLKFSNFYNSEWISRYLRCLFITINPGKIDPQNDLELAFGFFALLATSGSIGFMISSIQNITRAFNKTEEAKRYKKLLLCSHYNLKRESIRLINRFMNKRGVAFELQNKIRQYINSIYDRKYNSSLEEKKLIEKLSNSLREELMLKANRSILDKFPFFKNNFSEMTLRKIVLKMKAKNYFAEEIIFKVC